MDWFEEGGSGSPVDVQAVLDCDPIQHAISQIVAAGALVSMGITSDGGALGLTVTVDGKWRREYFRTSSDMSDWLLLALPHVLDACKGRDASNASRKRARRS
jgi:hypothetical protein